MEEQEYRFQRIKNLNEHIFSKIYKTIVKEIHEKSTAAKSISEETRPMDKKMS
jgi:hypothetical protein